MASQTTGHVEVQATSFHCFLELPPELRELIWTFCLPHRIWELDEPIHYGLWPEIQYADFDLNVNIDQDVPTPCRLTYTSLLNERPPVITRVCKESRKVALRAYGLISAWTTHDDHISYHSRDSPHTFAHPSYDLVAAVSREPLEYLLEKISCSSGRGSLMLQQLDKSCGEWKARVHNWPMTAGDESDNEGTDSETDSSASGADIDRDQEPWWPTEAGLPPDPPPFDAPKGIDQDIVVLQQRSDWLVVTEIIIVHDLSQVAIDTGLFGLLGDAPIQVIPVSDHLRVEALYNLAERCEGAATVDWNQNFTRYTQEHMVRRVRDALWWSHYPADLLSRLQPAIMFRLCTQMCNSC